MTNFQVRPRFSATLIKTCRSHLNASQSILFVCKLFGLAYWVLYDAGYNTEYVDENGYTVEISDEETILDTLKQQSCVSAVDIENARCGEPVKAKNGIIIISHMHEDHRGDVIERLADHRLRFNRESVLARLANRVYSNLDFFRKGVTEYEIPAHGPFSFRVLSSNMALDEQVRKRDISRLALDPEWADNSSLIISMTVSGAKQNGGDLKVLLPGDYNDETFKPAEGLQVDAGLLDGNGELGLFTPHDGVPYDVIVVPHHGSNLERSMMDVYTSLSDSLRAKHPLFIVANGSLTNASVETVGYKFYEPLNWLVSKLPEFTILASDVRLNLDPVEEDEIGTIPVDSVSCPFRLGKPSAVPTSYPMVTFRSAEESAVCVFDGDTWKGPNGALKSHTDDALKSLYTGDVPEFIWSVLARMPTSCCTPSQKDKRVFLVGDHSRMTVAWDGTRWDTARNESVPSQRSQKAFKKAGLQDTRKGRSRVPA